MVSVAILYLVSNTSRYSVGVTSVEVISMVQDNSSNQKLGKNMRPAREARLK